MAAAKRLHAGGWTPSRRGTGERLTPRGVGLAWRVDPSATLGSRQSEAGWTRPGPEPRSSKRLSGVTAGAGERREGKQARAAGVRWDRGHVADGNMPRGVGAVGTYAVEKPFRRNRCQASPRHQCRAVGRQSFAQIFREGRVGRRRRAAPVSRVERHARPARRLSTRETGRSPALVSEGGPSLSGAICFGSSPDRRMARAMLPVALAGKVSGKACLASLARAAALSDQYLHSAQAVLMTTTLLKHGATGEPKRIVSAAMHIFEVVNTVVRAYEAPAVPGWIGKHPHKMACSRHRRLRWCLCGALNPVVRLSSAPQRGEQILEGRFAHVQSTATTCLQLWPTGQVQIPSTRLRPRVMRC